jgi:diketogulonate reductase-like aldo/keto reductase
MPKMGCGTAVFDDIGANLFYRRSFVPGQHNNAGFFFPMAGPNQTSRSGDHATSIVEWALAAGHRLIDTAHMYENQPEIGDALKRAVSDGVVTREEVPALHPLDSGDAALGYFC